MSSKAALAEINPTCPSDHAMYYLGSKTLKNTPKYKASLTWSKAGNDSTIYELDNGLQLSLSFSETNFLSSNYPEVSSFSGVTINALNMRHSSQKINVNHKFTGIINKPVSKYGFVVQDLDANANGKYTESVSLITNGGAFSNYNTSNLALSNLNKTITAKEWLNCSPTSSCSFNIDWGSQLANTPFTITHGNTYANASTTTSTGDHLLGYSDFYFCLAPPKLIVKKQLNDIRVNDNDQFEIKVTGGKVANIFTTAGTGTTINNGSSSLIGLEESTSYKITERVVNGTIGDIANYNATYTCNNATTGSTTVMPTAAIEYDAAAKTRSFKLANATYGDEITCIITNTPKSYTFTGFVFNDNASITENNSIDLNTNTKSDISSTFTSNPKYFNGIFDQGESGISAAGLTVSLTNCDNTNITGTTAQLVGINPLSKGQYKFTVPGNIISSLTPQKVCLVQNEPSGWEFSVDTTPNSREVSLVSNLFDYKTESNGSRNLDFGEVKANYSALVLIKSQYVHDCNDARTFTNMPQNPQPDLPTNGFSTEGITGIVPGQCIAYKIDAYNRGHVDLKDVQISDKLQNKLDGKLVTSSFVMPLPMGSSNAVYNSRNPLPTGEIISLKFPLSKANGSTATKATLYFNTKYGTTVDP